MGYRECQPSPAVTVSYRRSDDLSEVTREWPAAGIDELAGAVPWRSFRWYRGQKHYSGTYWSSTVGGHVTYESRLELSRLGPNASSGQIRGYQPPPSTSVAS